jgi:hypothetical protein
MHGMFNDPLVAVPGADIKRKIAEFEMFIEYLKKELAQRRGDDSVFKYGYLGVEGYHGFDTFDQAKENIKNEPGYAHLPEEDRLYRIHKVFI